MAVCVVFSLLLLLPDPCLADIELLPPPGAGVKWWSRMSMWSRSQSHMGMMEGCGAAV